MIFGQLLAPAVCKRTGELHKIEKPALAKKLCFLNKSPTQVGVDIVAGFYLLYHLGPSVPQTFDKIAELILRKSEIHFDQYFDPSIKDTEKQNHTQMNAPFMILGSSQIQANDFYKTPLFNHWKQLLFIYNCEYCHKDGQSKL